LKIGRDVPQRRRGINEEEKRKKMKEREIE
jgi:hypothetical protein